MLKMKQIGVDIDGTLSEQLNATLEYLEEEEGFSFDITANDINSWDFYLKDTSRNGKKKISTFLEDILSNPIFLEYLKPIEGAKDSLNKLSERFEILIITARNGKNANVKKFTEEWLKENGFNYKAIYFVSNHQKSNFEIEFLIEDNPLTAIDVARKGIKVLLLSRPYNRNLKWMKFKERMQFRWLKIKGYILRVNSWYEILTKSLDF